jgi:hypothetical protein
VVDNTTQSHFETAFAWFSQTGTFALLAEASDVKNRATLPRLFLRLIGKVGIRISKDHLREGLKYSDYGPYPLLVDTVFEYREPSLEGEQSQNEQRADENLAAQREAGQ